MSASPTESAPGGTMAAPDPGVSLELEGAYRVTYRILRTALRAICKLWFRFEVHGRENLPATGGFVLAPGAHRSIIDTPMVSLAGPRVLRYMGAENYFSIPVFGFFLKAMGGFPVERAATDRQAMRLAEWILRNGEPLAVFPESTRGEGPIVGELKEGASFLACRTGVPIVPVGLGGGERALPKGRNVARPRKIVLVIGEPIHPPVKEGRVKRSDVRGVTAELHESLQQLFDEAQIRAGC
ncbi:MAG: lysophospholipid acyltransferase family protein [Actinomycetota bacterium]